MLFDIRRLRWDPELLELFSIPEQMLPRCSLRAASTVNGLRSSAGRYPLRARRETSRARSLASAASRPAT
ncbi:MAG: hypothetical protein ACLUEK_15070 [Oscillospiraceae bacterium]